MEPSLKMVQHILRNYFDKVYHIVPFAICVMVKINFVKLEKMYDQFPFNNFSLEICLLSFWLPEIDFQVIGDMDAWRMLEPFF